MISSEQIVSVVVPLQGAGTWLEPAVAETLDVLNRNYQNYELILVDDCAPPETQARLEELLRKHEAVRLIQLSRRYGSEIAITAGLESAMGDYVVVMRLGCDEPGEIPAMIEAATKHDGLVLGTSSDRGHAGWIFGWCRSLFY
jgi:dolichol-phosphate mannosyltransferase